MKIQAAKTITTVAVVLLATLITVDMSQARMGGGGHGGFSGSGMSGDSGRGSDDSYGDRDHRDKDWDRDEKHRSDSVSRGAYGSMSTGDMSNGGVLMELKPTGVIDGKFHVHFSASTSGGNLGDHDLLQQCTLEFGDKVIHPTEVNHMSGRHAEGTMVFDLDEMPEHFSIIISGIPGENHRIYKW